MSKRKRSHKDGTDDELLLSWKKTAKNRGLSVRSKNVCLQTTSKRSWGCPNYSCKVGIPYHLLVLRVCLTHKIETVHKPKFPEESSCSSPPYRGTVFLRQSPMHTELPGGTTQKRPFTDSQTRISTMHALSLSNTNVEGISDT